MELVLNNCDNCQSIDVPTHPIEKSGIIDGVREQIPMNYCDICYGLQNPEAHTQLAYCTNQIIKAIQGR